MIANVLVPLDGTLLAEHAVPTATSIVRRRHGHLELMLVRQSRHRAGLEDWPWAVGGAAAGDEYIADQARQWGELSGGVVGYASVDGDVATEICRRASETHADLIVMSTHGRTGFARAFGGSVADAVIRRSSVPVLLLRPPLPGQHARRSALRFQRILVTVDGSGMSEAIFPALVGLAERGVTEILLLRVVEPVRESRSIALGYVAGAMDRDATEAAVSVAELELERTAERLADFLGCDVFPHVVIDDTAARGIARFAHHYNASLIAMTTHGRGASRLVLGSVADGVLRDSHLPMLIVRPPRGASDAGRRSS